MIRVTSANYILSGCMQAAAHQLFGSFVGRSSSTSATPGHTLCTTTGDSATAMNQHSSRTSTSNSRRVPQELRQRTERSCDRCKSKKQKCNKWPGQAKCQHCQKYGYDCVVTKPRKQRLYGSVETHGAKVALLESLVKGLMPEADVSNMDSMQEMARSLGIPVPEMASSRSREKGSSVPAVDVGDEGEKDCLVHDLQGQGQYIGRASSYIFQMTLRGLVGGGHKGPAGRMYLFGPNPAHDSVPSSTSHDNEEPLDLQAITSVSPPISNDAGRSPLAKTVHTYQKPLIFSLVRAFFDHVNVDFPVLHEATFLEQLDAWCQCPTAVDQVWVCSLLCVLILGRRHCSVPVTKEQEESWWVRIRHLLSQVMFTSSLGSIQGLMLTALHLHNTNSRDICWTLTGAAVRIGFAIGLHRDVEVDGTPLAREMRKRVWWTLYAFEQLQVSSHDRPSAIDSSSHLGRSPRETTLGMGSHSIPDYLTWSNRLVVLLGSTCQALPDVAKNGYSGPLSPAAGLLRELSRWRSTLPQHLSMDSVDTMPPSFQRPLILLHVQHHYIVTLISRYALVARFTRLSKERSQAFPDSLVSVSDSCIESGRLSCRLLLKLDSVKGFNAVTWLDVYYLYSSCLVLALSILCDSHAKTEDQGDLAPNDRMLLNECMGLATKQSKNPMIPGTMRRWLSVVGELETLVADFTGSHFAKQQASPAPTDQETLPRRVHTPDVPVPEQRPRCATLEQPRQVDPQQPGDGAQVNVTWTLTQEDLGFCNIQPDLAMPNLSSLAESGFNTIAYPCEDLSEAQFWHELHWEGISDMLLGVETRSRIS